MKIFITLLAVIVLVAGIPGPGGPLAQPDYPTDGADPVPPPQLIEPPSSPPGPIGPPGPGSPPGPSAPGCMSGPGGPCPRQYDLTGYASQCGVKCETKCQTIGVPIDATFAADSTKGCDWGCACKEGYIRTSNNACVLQTPGTCAVNPCASAPNTIWRRCALRAGPTCYIRNCKRADVMQSRCVCRAGYSLDLKQNCISTTSVACKKLARTYGC